MSAKRSLSEQVQSLSLREEESLDEAFDSATPRLNVPKSRRTMLPCDDLIEYEDHNFQSITGRPQPFKEYGQKEMDELIASVKEHGVLQEITVRPWNGKYQILAGRHRTRAAKANHLKTIPGVIRDVDDVEAAYIVLHSNLQRHDLSYSERAWAYRMERDLRAHQGKRTDLEETSCNDCTRLDVLQEIGEKSNASRRTIAYLIRLTYLIPQLMELVDNGDMKVTVGVKLSYVPHELQQYIFNSIIPKYGIIKSYQAERIQNLLKENRLTLSEMLSVFEDKRERRATGKISFSRKKLAEFADILPDEESVKRLFFEFLAQYREQMLKGA